MRRILLTLLALATLTIAGSGHAQNAVISIDNVSYDYGPTMLLAGGVHQVSIRYNCLGLSSEHFWGGSNGFEVYSPDGADWGYLQGSAGPLLQTAVDRGGQLLVVEKHYSTAERYSPGSWTVTGNGGADPVGGSTGPTSGAAFYLATVSPYLDAGYIGGLDNDIAVTLEFQTRVVDHNLTMCIDTNNAITAWEWAAGSNGDDPIWDNGLGVNGPRCWEIYLCPCGCGVMRVGDANGSGEDEPTIADVSAMIDAKFISGTCDGTIACLQEADVNLSGGEWPDCDDITVGDISYLVDYLFITGPELGLPSVWWW